MGTAEIIFILVVICLFAGVMYITYLILDNEKKCRENCEDKGLILLEGNQNYCKCIDETGGIFYTKPTK